MKITNMILGRRNLITISMGTFKIINLEQLSPNAMEQKTPVNGFFFFPLSPRRLRMVLPLYQILHSQKRLDFLSKAKKKEAPACLAPPFSNDLSFLNNYFN